MAERLSEVEADALLDDAEFQGLVEGYRRFMDLPAAERRERLVAIAFCELEAAALDGDIKVCCFLLKEDRLRRCPAETLADALEARMAALPSPPPAPRPGGAGQAPNPDEGPRWCAEGAGRIADAMLGDLAAAPLPPDPAPPQQAPADDPQVEPQAPAADAASRLGPGHLVPSQPQPCSGASSPAASPAWPSASTRASGTPPTLTTPAPRVAPGAPRPRRVSRHPRPTFFLSMTTADRCRPARCRPSSFDMGGSSGPGITSPGPGCRPRGDGPRPRQPSCAGAAR